MTQSQGHDGLTTCATPSAPREVLSRADGAPCSVAVITGPALNNRHGTGVQILRVFGQSPVPYWHLHWASTAGLDSDCQHSAMLKTFPRLKRLRGGRLLEMVESALGVAWWRGQQVNARKLRRLLDKRSWRADVAYAVVASEDEAELTASILEVLGCPYVVHVMDLCHDDGMDSASMSGYRRLFASAGAILAITDSIAEQIRKFDGAAVQLVGVGQQVTPAVTSPPRPGEPLRVLLVGSLGDAANPALAVLERAWPLLVAQGGAELVYFGRHVHLLPPSLKAIVHHQPNAPIEDYQREISRCHLAYLPSPHRLDCYGRFSLTSRLADYFMAPLPVAACVVDGSATRRFLEPLSPHAVRIVRDETQLAQAAEFFRHEDHWRRACTAVRQAAMEHFDIDVIRGRIMAALETARRSGKVIRPEGRP